MPSSLLSLRSMRFAHEAQVMPPISSSMPTSSGRGASLVLIRGLLPRGLRPRRMRGWGGSAAAGGDRPPREGRAAQGDVSAAGRPSEVSGADGGVAGLLDGGEHGGLVDRGVGADAEQAGLVADLDAGDARDLADLLADGRLAVAAGHAGDLEVDRGRAHGTLLVMIRVYPQGVSNCPHLYPQGVCEFKVPAGERGVVRHPGVLRWGHEHRCRRPYP